jgi:DNA polymerase III psi subunit
MLEPGQLSTLTEMGIPVWELRSQEKSSPATTTIETVHAELYQPLPVVDCLMVVAEQDDSDEARRLLNAMLFSIGLTPNNSAIVSPKQLSQLVTSPTQHKVLVAFGEQLVPQTLSSQATDRGHIYSSSDLALKIIISLPLKTLLKSPDKKALAWQDLQLLKVAYQPINRSQ